MSTPRQALSCLAGLLLASGAGVGCTGDCVGAGCDDLYSATQLTLKLGDESNPSADQQSPIEGAEVLLGAQVDGQGWSAALAPDTLLLGLPERSQVRSMPLSYDGQSVALDTPGLFSGVLSGEAQGDRFGAAVAALGRSDGPPWLLVGAPDRQGGGTALEAGAVYLLEGLGAGWDRELRVGTDALDAADLPGRRVLSEANYDHLGEVVAGCVDLDGDGNEDALIAAPWDSTAANLGGQVHAVLTGTLEGLGRLLRAGELQRGWTGAHEGGRLGDALSCRHDITGDGVVDLLLGAPFADSALFEGAGAVYLLSGAAIPASGPVEDAASTRLSGPSPESYFGASLATGDLDGDGIADLAVGAPGSGNGRGAVYVYDGARLVRGDIRHRFRLAGVGSGDRLGVSVTMADLDGDGLQELLMGAPQRNPTDADQTFAAGALYVVAGAANFETWGELSVGDQATTTYERSQGFLRVGQRVVSGDANQDGAEDLLLLMDVEPR